MPYFQGSDAMRVSVSEERQLTNVYGDRYLSIIKWVHELILIRCAN